MSGVHDAGGGGGQGEKGGGTKRYRATGGGAGGSIILQGVDVAITGTLVANGGGGGGCDPNGLSIFNGQDGTRTTSRALGGVSPCGDGGAGGALNPATDGNRSRGAGGGSAGFIQVLLPGDRAPTLQPFVASPTIEVGVVGSNI